jgi:DNA-directed RNA polymerase subunit RPC12/RpoP
MHPQIHATKPGNCPICGMKLVKEKPKSVTQPVIQKPNEIQKPKDTTKSKSMDMGKKDSIQIQTTTYTCPMHPEIHSTKPGNCPKCGMKLIMEKSKTIANPTDKHDEMPKDTSKEKPIDMGNMKMDNMEKPKAETMKTIVNNTPPRTVRYDLYIRDTIVNFSGKSKR